MKGEATVVDEGLLQSSAHMRALPCFFLLLTLSRITGCTWPNMIIALLTFSPVRLKAGL